MTIGVPVDAGGEQKVVEIWRQNRLPVIFRPARGDAPELKMRLPYQPDNRIWLRDDRHRRPTWHRNGKYWEVPGAWYSQMVTACLHRYGAVYTIGPVNQMEKCAPACWEALGEECACSCMGFNHGIGRPDGRWYEISEALAVQWKGRSLRWSLLKVKER